MPSLASVATAKLGTTLTSCHQGHITVTASTRYTHVEISLSVAFEGAPVGIVGDKCRCMASLSSSFPSNSIRDGHMGGSWAAKDAVLSSLGTYQATCKSIVHRQGLIATQGRPDQLKEVLSRLVGWVIRS